MTVTANGEVDWEHEDRAPTRRTGPAGRSGDIIT